MTTVQPQASIASESQSVHYRAHHRRRELAASHNAATHPRFTTRSSLHHDSDCQHPNSAPSVLSHLVGLSVPFLGRSRAHPQPPALRLGIADTSHRHNIGLALHQLPAHRASSVTNVTRSVSSNTIDLRSHTSSTMLNSITSTTHAVNLVTSTTRSTHHQCFSINSVISISIASVRLLLHHIVVSLPLRRLPFQSSTSQSRVLTS